MAKLILKRGSSVLKEIPLQKENLTIGRTPANDLVIDNPTVSGRHARIVMDRDHFLIEDMSSLHGTFLNSQRIRKTSLRHGDEILIGKQTLVFQEDNPPSIAEPAADRGGAVTAPIEEPIIPEIIKRREVPAKPATVAAEGRSAEEQEKIGCLTVLTGKTGQREYLLTDEEAVIGKSDSALVKLQGWFVPKSAAVIRFENGVYTIAPSDKADAVKVNSQPLTGNRNLEEGDVIEVAGVKLQFYYQ